MLLLLLQGFCCQCTSGQVWQQTTGSAQQRTRAGLNCDYLENPWVPLSGTPKSAHCLVYQPNWCVPPLLGHMQVHACAGCLLHEYTGVESLSSTFEPLTAANCCCILAEQQLYLQE
jgi:Male gamete fusion factor